MDNNKLLNKDLFSTPDLGLAAAVSLFYPIKSIDRANPKKIYFLFQKSDVLDSIIERYWQGRLKHDIKSYFNNLKMLKNLIYESPMTKNLYPRKCGQY